MRVIVCGGGVIGACTAYFLAQRGIEAVVVESTDVACAASGKSGGFLARDWCDGTSLAALARRSFDLHAELAERYGRDRWDYRRLETLAVAAGPGMTGRAGRGERPGWLGPGAVVQGRLGGEATTAQIHPARFTRGMLELAEERGASLRRGRVEGIDIGEDGRLRGAVVDGETVMGDAVVIAMGPWSILAARWLPLPAVHGLKGSSVVFRSTEGVAPQALFVDCAAETGETGSPEVFPRPDGTTYVCGLPSEAPLPLDPADVAPDAGARERLVAMTASFAPELARAEVLIEQACYRPVTRDGLPLIGPIAGVEGAYVATGHSVWGMLNAPATGEALAERIAEGRASTVELAPFDPARLPPLPPAAVTTG